MALTIKDLAAQFASKKKTEFQGNGNYYPFYDMKDDESATIRFLPDADQDNPHGFVYPKHSHTFQIGEKKVTMACLKQYGEACEACETSSKYYKAGDKIMGKKFWRSESHVAQILVKEDPLPPNEAGETHAGQYRLINIGFQLYQVLTAAFKAGELDELPFAYKGGTDFVISKSKQGQYSVYNLGSRFVRRSTDLTPEQEALAESKLVALKSTLPEKPDANRMRQLIAQVLDPSLVAEVEDQVESALIPPAVPQVQRVSAPAPSASPTATASAAADILASIRARNAAKTNA